MQLGFCNNLMPVNFHKKCYRFDKKGLVAKKKIFISSLDRFSFVGNYLGCRKYKLILRPVNTGAILSIWLWNFDCIVCRKHSCQSNRLDDEIVRSLHHKELYTVGNEFRLHPLANCVLIERDYGDNRVFCAWANYLEWKNL